MIAVRVRGRWGFTAFLRLAFECLWYGETAFVIDASAIEEITEKSEITV